MLVGLLCLSSRSSIPQRAGRGPPLLLSCPPADTAADPAPRTTFPSPSPWIRQPTKMSQSSSSPIAHGTELASQRTSNRSACRYGRHLEARLFMNPCSCYYKAPWICDQGAKQGAIGAAGSHWCCMVHGTTDLGYNISGGIVTDVSRPELQTSQVQNQQQNGQFGCSRITGTFQGLTAIKQTQGWRQLFAGLSLNSIKK